MSDGTIEENDDDDRPQNRGALRVVRLMARALGDYPDWMKPNSNDLRAAQRVYRTLAAHGREVRQVQPDELS